jgi:glycosyltransferase 2 family protein
MNDIGSGSLGSANASANQARGRGWNIWWPRLVIALALGISTVLLYRTLTQYDAAELVQSIRAVSSSSLLAAIGWAAASYACLTANDWLAVRYACRPLPYRQTALTSFVALSFGHNIGFAALSSGAIRYRFYSKAGLGVAEVAKVIVFCGCTIFIGMFILGVAALIGRPDLAEQVTGVSRNSVRAIGAVLSIVPCAYLAASLLRHPLRLSGRSVEIPSPRLVLGQMVVGTVNFLFVAACLDATVSAISDVHYFEVLSAFILANTATILTHTPGGLGVIEAVVLLVLQRPDLIGAVLLFRFVYFLLPLSVGAMLFVIVELRGASAVASPERSRGV